MRRILICSFVMMTATASQAQSSLTRDTIMQRIASGRPSAGVPAAELGTPTCYGSDLRVCATSLGGAVITSYEAKTSGALQMVEAGLPLAAYLNGQSAAIGSVFGLIYAFEPDIKDADFLKVAEPLLAAMRKASNVSMLDQPQQASSRHGRSNFLFRVSTDGMRLSAYRD